MLKPHKLLDWLQIEFQVRNDAGLSRALDIPPPVLSKYRNGKLNVGAMLIVKVLDNAPHLSIADLREQMDEVES